MGCANQGRVLRSLERLLLVRIQPSGPYPDLQREASGPRETPLPPRNMKDTKRQNRPDEHVRRVRADGNETLSELLSPYSPKQRETLLKGFRIPAKVAVRAHLKRQAAKFEAEQRSGSE